MNSDRSATIATSLSAIAMVCDRYEQDTNVPAAEHGQFMVKLMTSVAMLTIANGPRTVSEILHHLTLVSELSHAMGAERAERGEPLQAHITQMVMLGGQAGGGVMVISTSGIESTNDLIAQIRTLERITAEKGVPMEIERRDDREQRNPKE